MLFEFFYAAYAVITVYLLNKTEVTKLLYNPCNGDTVHTQKICHHLLADFFVYKHLAVVVNAEAVGIGYEEVCHLPLYAVAAGFTYLLIYKHELFGD